MNKGIKKSCSFLTNEIDRAGKVYINTNKNYANIHMIVPLCELDRKEINLVYTNNGGVEEFYGRKIGLSILKTLTKTNDNLMLKEADGSIYQNITNALEHGYTLTEDDTKYYLTNIVGDKYEYTKVTSGEMKPEKLVLKKGQTLNFTYQNNKLTQIVSSKGMSLSLTYQTNGMLGQYQIYKDEENLLYTINITYDNNNYISKIEYVKNNVIIYRCDYLFETETISGLEYVKLIKVIDSITNYRVYYTLENNIVKSYKDGYDDTLAYGKKTEITYYDYKTNIKNYKNAFLKQYFDENNMLKYETFEETKIAKYGYDQNENLILQTKMYDCNETITSVDSLLKNGYFSSGLGNWTISNENAVTRIDREGRFASMLKDKTLKITNNTNEDISISQIVDIELDEPLTLAFFNKILSYSSSDESYLKVKLYLGDSNNVFLMKQISIDKTKTDWEFNLVSLYEKSKYTRCKVEFIVGKNTTVVLGGIQLYKKTLETFYEYGSSNNLTSAYTVELSYDAKYEPTMSNTLPSEVVGFDYSLTKYKYSSHNNLTKIIGMHGLTCDRTYNDRNELLTNTIRYQDKYIKNENKYRKYGSSELYLNKIISQENKTTEIYVDKLYEILRKEISPNDVITTYGYDEKDNLTSITKNKNTKTSNATYEYYSTGNLKKLTSADGLIYNFEYDSFNRIKKVILQKGEVLKPLIEYQYLVRTYNNEEVNLDLVEKLIIDQTEYIYDYDSFYKLITIVKKEGEIETEILRNYYDVKENLMATNDNTNSENEIWYIVYDIKNRIIEQYNTTKGINLNYLYNQYNELYRKNYKIGAKQDITSYSTISRSKGMSPENYYEGAKTKFSKAYYNFFNDSNNPFRMVKRYKPYGSTNIYETLLEPNNLSLLNVVDVKCENNINYFDCYNQENYLKYTVDFGSDYPCETLLFWVKPTESNTGKYLLSIGKTDKNFVGVYINSDSKVVLKVIDAYGTSQDLIVTKELDINEWNCIGLNIFNRQIEEVGGSGDEKSKYELLVNGELYTFTKENPRLDISFSSSCKVNFGADLNDTSKFIGKITGIYITDDDNYYLKETLYEMYNLTKEYIIDSSNTQDDETLDTKYVSLTTKYNQISDIFDFIPLHDDVNSIKGVTPTSHTKRATIECDKDRVFNYDKDVNRYVFEATGEQLIYPYNLTDSGTIGLRFKTGVVDTEQVLFDLFDDTNNLTLVKKGKTLYVEYNDKYYSTGLTYTHNKWSTVFLTWTKTTSSTSVSTTTSYSVKVKLDDLERQITITPDTLLSNTSLMIGRRRRTRLEDGIYCDDSLKGRIENIVISNTLSSTTTLTKLKTQMNLTTKSNHLDAFGLLRKTQIKNDNKTLLSQKLEYKEEGNRIIPLVQKETIQTQYETKVIEYDYDDENNLKKYNEKNYEYDYRGNLEKETIDDVFYYQYTYDNNGNMMKKEKKYIDTNYVSISTSYTYDTIIPNRLLEEKIEECDVLVPGIGGILGPKITIKTLTYDGLSLYPNKIGSKTLLWDLNKLKQVTDTSSIVKYKYNYKGQRIKKEVSGTITEYYYDNDLLIAEKTNGNYMYYTYDENNNLYSLETNEGIYYYIKDICKNILGLVDTNGNYIIKYSYDGWGKLREKEIITSCYASNNNPFIYKGYYYDVETQLYWVSSRYYSPELCRWISPDCVCYLNPTSINGLNLYSYCYNDPINYIDISGCYPVKIQVGRLTIYFHPPHGNGPNAQHHIHIKNGNVKVASRNYDGSVHDKKYGKNYVPSKEVYNALLEQGWDWYGNKFSLFDFSGLYREEFPLQQSGYSLEQFQVTNMGSSLEVFPSLNNGFVLETFPQVTLGIPYYNPFPLTNQEKQILVVTAIVIVAVVAIALIPATGGGSAVLLLA